MANGMKIWKGIGNTTTLLFSLNRLMEYMMVLPEINIELKKKLVRSYVWSIALYGSENWNVSIWKASKCGAEGYYLEASSSLLYGQELVH